MLNSRYSGLDLRRAKYGRKMGQIYLSRHLLCGIRMWYKLNLFAFLYDENLIIWFYCFAIFTLWSHLNPMKIPKLEPLYQILYHINEIMISLYIWYLNFYQIFCYVEELPENVYDYFISEAGQCKWRVPRQRSDLRFIWRLNPTLSPAL